MVCVGRSGGTPPRGPCRCRHRRRSPDEGLDASGRLRTLRPRGFVDPRDRARSSGLPLELRGDRRRARAGPSTRPLRPTSTLPFVASRGSGSFRDGRGDRTAGVDPGLPGVDRRAVPALPVCRPRRCTCLGSGPTSVAARREPDAVPECPGGDWLLQRQAPVPARCARRPMGRARRIPERDPRRGRPMVDGGAPRRENPVGDVSSGMPGWHRRFRGVVVRVDTGPWRSDEHVHPARSVISRRRPSTSLCRTRCRPGPVIAGEIPRLRGCSGSAPSERSRLRRC